MARNQNRFFHVLLGIGVAAAAMAVQAQAVVVAAAEQLLEASKCG